MLGVEGSPRHNDPKGGTSSVGIKKLRSRGPGRPQIPKDERRVAVSYSLSPEGVRRVKLLAKMRGQPQARVLEDAIESAFYYWAKK